MCNGPQRFKSLLRSHFISAYRSFLRRILEVSSLNKQVHQGKFDQCTITFSFWIGCPYFNSFCCCNCEFLCVLHCCVTHIVYNSAVAVVFGCITSFVSKSADLGVRPYSCIFIFHIVFLFCAQRTTRKKLTLLSCRAFICYIWLLRISALHLASSVDITSILLY